MSLTTQMIPPVPRRQRSVVPHARPALHSTLGDHLLKKFKKPNAEGFGIHEKASSPLISYIEKHFAQRGSLRLLTSGWGSAG